MSTYNGPHPTPDPNHGNKPFDPPMPNPEQTAVHPSGMEQKAVELVTRAIAEHLGPPDAGAQGYNFYAETWIDCPALAKHVITFLAARPLDTRKPDPRVAALVAGVQRIADESWIHDKANRGGVALYAARIIAAFQEGGNVDG
jgi:hypothetical protein